MSIRSTKVWDDLWFVLRFFPIVCIRHLIANKGRLICGQYRDEAGRGCFFHILSELLPQELRISSPASLTSFFVGRSGPGARELPEYQPARWLVRLIDGHVCCTVRARYGGISHLDWDDALECVEEHLRFRIGLETEALAVESRALARLDRENESRREVSAR